jgi:uncharacterized membrane protein
MKATPVRALRQVRPIAHWQPTVAVLVGAGIFWLVAREVSPVLSAVMFGVLFAVLIGVSVTRRRARYDLTRPLAMTLALLMAIALAGSVAYIIAELVAGKFLAGWIGLSPSPSVLLLDAALIWISNVLVFAFWYWEVDAGGPLKRHAGIYSSDDLVFPQRQHDGTDDWMPDFLDYLFLAFNSSTAFSPTDTLILSRRMKVLMMCQSLISLCVLAVVAARAVNALG